MSGDVGNRRGLEFGSHAGDSDMASGNGNGSIPRRHHPAAERRPCIFRKHKRGQARPESPSTDPQSGLETQAEIDIERKRQELYGYIDSRKVGKWRERIDLVGRATGLLLATAASVIVLVLIARHPPTSPFALSGIGISGGGLFVAYESWRYYKKNKEEDDPPDDPGPGRS